MTAFLAAFLLFATAAFAQQPAPSPEQSAAINLGQQIGFLTYQNGQLQALLQTTQQENAKLKAELEALKKPKEPAK